MIAALSGGVDSSVAALLLRRDGHAVEALFMKNWEETAEPGRCSAEADVEDALSVCEALAIPLNTVDFSAQYWQRVFTRFLAEYRAGRTPNPDVLCNREIKFRAFLDHALAAGADVIATGHYARIARGADGRLTLLRGVDRGKDQSYFLYTLDQHALAHATFPVGHLDKPAVRRLAREAGLATQDKPDSTGLCFIGERPFRAFLARYLACEPGAIETVDGRTIGTHQGSALYTLGQRQGLGIGGIAGGRGGPWYVVAKDPARNVLVADQDPCHPRLMSTRVRAGELSWVAGEPPPLPLACTARTRYRQPDQACTLVALEGDRCECVFERPQRAITPGQSVVFYDGEVCLGGGVIAGTG